MPNKILSAEFVRSILNYDPQTGIMMWIRTISNRAQKGHIVVYKTNGYAAVRICGKLYRVHRLAWLIMTGSWPEFEIDHKDRDRSNNRWDNLRPATRAENARNTNAHNDGSGCKGVSFHAQSGKWRSRIFMEGKEKSLGLYQTKEDASAAYNAAAVNCFGDFAGRA